MTINFIVGTSIACNFLARFCAKRIVRISGVWVITELIQYRGFDDDDHMILITTIFYSGQMVEYMNIALNIKVSYRFLGTAIFLHINWGRKKYELFGMNKNVSI